MSDNDSAVCYEITPPRYKLFHCPRSDHRGGGTALLFRDNINVCKLESGSRNSFELSEYLVCTGSLRIRLVIIYQPPCSINHPMTVNSFIDKFSKYLESVILSNDLLCLTGDFNVHVDDHNDPAACRFKVGRVSFRKLRSIDKDAFMDEIIRNSELFQMDTDDPEELAALFDSTFCSLLDCHAPVKHKNTTSQPCVPWMNDEIKLAKRQRRKTEKKWRASKAHIDLLSYRTMRNRVLFLSNKVRSDYYTNFITENSTDQRRLFRASKSLLNLSKGSGLPLSTNDYQLANDLENSSPKKLLISGLLIQTRSAFRPINATSTVTASCFSEFNLLSESEVFDLITASSKKSCPLDPIPTKLLNECVDVLATASDHQNN